MAPDGNDADPGTRARPWRTIQKAADQVLAGDRVYIRSGSYAPFVIRRSGTITDPVVFAGYPADPTRPVIDGLDTAPWVVDLGFVHDVELRRIEITGGYMARQNGGGLLINNSQRVLVTDSVVHDNSAFGIRSWNSTDITILANDIYGNGQGVDIRMISTGTRILNNLIHDQDRMMVNTVGGDDDVGAIGIGFVFSTGAVTASGNQLWNNRAASYEYGWDGSPFEIYGASDVTITDNRMWDNNNVLETGTSSSRACANNVFTRNVAWDGNDATRSAGLMLRCAKDMLIAHNTFVELDEWLYTINTYSSKFRGDVSGLRVVNNVNLMAEGKIYALGSGIPLSTMTIDHNLDWNPGNTVAEVAGYGNAMTTAQLTVWTGMQANGIHRAPVLANVPAGDFSLVSGSPGIDGGMVVAGWGHGYLGSAPDIGGFETE